MVGLYGGGYFATDVGSSTAFGGSPTALPGTVQAENYDSGGEGVAFHVPGTPAASAYRADNAGVCAEATGNALCGIAANAWFKYRTSVTAGTYDITLHAKAGTAGATVHLEVNGVNDTGPIALPTSGYGDVVISGVELAGGSQYLKLYVEAGSASVDYMRFDRR